MNEDVNKLVHCKGRMFYHISQPTLTIWHLWRKYYTVKRLFCL